MLSGQWDVAVSLQTWRHTADLDESLEAGFPTDNTPVFYRSLLLFFKGPFLQCSTDLLA